MAGRRRPRAIPATRKRHFLKEWRRYRGLTQEQLAERIDTSASTISQLETGKQGYTQRTLEELALALATEPASLLAENPADGGDVWRLLERLRQLSPTARRQALTILDALSDTGTDR